MKPYVVLLSGLLLMAPAAAQTSDTNATSEQPAAQSQTQPEQSQQPADPNRRICRKVDTNTGSRVPYRTVCLTERQWRNYRAN